MTFPLIDRVRRLAEKASAGPWRNDRPPEYKMSEIWGPDGPGCGCIVTAYPCRPVEREANKDFIAAMRTDAPALADVAEQLQTALRACHEWIGGLPITPSFEDKRAMQAAIEGVLALAEKE